MHLCDDTITIFNRRLDDDKGYELYYPTVINKVSWYSGISTTVDNGGLHAADQFTIRIPMDAEFNGAQYVDPLEYKNAVDVTGLFTLANGDVIVKASIAAAPMRPKEIFETYHEACTVVGVTDNRRAPNAPHFRVVGS